jgi:hypothetical protein
MMSILPLLVFIFCLPLPGQQKFLFHDLNLVHDGEIRYELRSPGQPGQKIIEEIKTRLGRKTEPRAKIMIIVSGDQKGFVVEVKTRLIHLVGKEVVLSYHYHSEAFVSVERLHHKVQATLEATSPPPKYSKHV